MSKITLWYEEPNGVRHFAIHTADLSAIQYYTDICPQEYKPVIVLDDGTTCMVAEVKKS